MSNLTKQQGKALALVKNAIEAIEPRLRKASLKAEHGGRSAPQLRMFLAQLKAMKSELEAGSASGQHLGLGRTIVDSWPLNSELGELLLAAEQEYVAASAI